MSINVQWVIAIGILFYYIIIIFMINKNFISLRHSLLWMFWGGVLLAIDFFPGSLNYLAGIMGIETPINAFFLVCIFLIFINCIWVTALCSRLFDNTRILVQRIGILEKRLRELEGDSD